MSRKEEYLQNKLDQYKYHDFCKHFTLNDPIKEFNFNRKYSQPDLIYVFYEENDFTKRLYKSIDYRINDQNYAVFIIHGEAHLGKSEAVQTLAKYTTEKFLEFLGLSVKLHLGFSSMAFNRILRLLKIGDVSIRDESPKGSGAGSRNMGRNLDNITKIVREAQNFFYFASPEKIESKFATYYLECAGKKSVHTCLKCKKSFVNIRTKICPECHTKLFLDYGKCQIRCLLYDPSYMKGEKPIGRVFIPLHTDEAFRKDYKERKSKNIRIMKIRGGGDYYEIDAEQYEKDTKILVEILKPMHSHTFNNIDTQITNWNIKCRKEKKEEEMIVGDGNYMKKLVQNVKNILDSKESVDLTELEIPDVPIETIGTGFTNFLMEFYFKNLPPRMTFNRNVILLTESIIDVLKQWSMGESRRNISVPLPSGKYMHQGLIIDIIKTFSLGKRGTNLVKDDWRFYKVYEYWIARRVNGVVISGVGKPDLKFVINGKEYYGECKIWENIKKSLTIDKTRFNCYNKRPDDNKYFFLFFRNVKWGDIDHISKVYYKGEQSHYLNRDGDDFILDDDLELENLLD